jgi:RNA polymerase sigma-70 factor (ECF subfamily)
MLNSKQAKIKRLIEGCQINDRRAQEELYRMYFGLMMSISMRYCGNWNDAMEVVNSGFLKIFTKIGSYKGKGSFEGWMRKTIVNTALDFIKQNNQISSSIEDVNIYEEKLFIENDAVFDLDKEEILKIVQELPPMTRAVFMLNVMEGMKHREISKELGISEGTSHWHLQNARKLLKTKIEKFLNS